MTAPANKAPISVDYTGRDYYAIRSQLIERVKDRVPDWQGNDANDFGLALVESFAYMGDLLNYYIDRAANESYLLTATQRESLLNIASMYGYKPAHYVGASTTLTLTNTGGYSGAVRATTIEPGEIGGITKNYAKVIINSGHPFSVDGEFNQIKISGVATTTPPSEVGGKTVSYNTSVYNGTFNIDYVGYNNIGKNVVWFRPVATISSIVPNGDNTQFTVTLSETGRSLSPSDGQKVVISGSTVSSGANYNGRWVIDTSTTADATTAASFTVKVDSSQATITKAAVVGSTFVYSAWNNFVVGEHATITGVKSANNTSATAGSGFNLTNVAVTAVKDIVTPVTNVTADGTTVTYIVGSGSFEANDFVSFVNIKSAGNTLGTAGSGYNLTDAQVATSSYEVWDIQSLTPDSNAAGKVVFETTSEHDIKVGDYVTIEGVVNTANTTTDRTDVYNMKEAKVIAKTATTFTVEAWWTNDYDATASTAPTVKRFYITVTSAATGELITTGGAVCKQFVTAASGTPGAWQAPSGSPQAIAVIGGTFTSTTAQVVYSELPAIIQGGAVTNIGSTIVPKGSQVVTQVTVDGAAKDVVFSTLSDAAIFFQQTADVTAVHGEDISLRKENAKDTSARAYDIDGESLGFSDGKANQKFALKEMEVDPRTVRVFVDSGISWDEWLQVEHIEDYPPVAHVFQTIIASDNTVYVAFGDGISGSIPDKEAGIKAVYIAGGGTYGNVSAGSLSKWGVVPGLNSAVIKDKITVTNASAATGGTDPESNDSIRYNAPRALRAMNRAVTLEDFGNLALTSDGVAKANAIASSRSSVTVYIAPVSSDNSGEQVPGFMGDIVDYLDETPQMVLLKESVFNNMEDKLQIGTTLTVSSPTYTAAWVKVTFSVLPRYNVATVEAAIKKAILDGFSYNNVNFADVITPEEVEFKLRQVDGVSNVRVTELYREGGEGRNSLVGDANEIFVFTESAITLTSASTDATLSALTIAPKNAGGSSSGSAALSPATFNGSVFSYTLTLPATTTQVTLTPSLHDATAVLSVNGKPVTTSTYTEPVATGDTLALTVTAEDGVTVQTYKFKVSVSS